MVIEKENVLNILIETKKAINENNVLALKLLSNRTIHTSSIYQDPDNIAIAVIVYALGKIIERKKYTNYPSWPKFYKNVLVQLDLAIISLKNNDFKKFRKAIKNIRKSVEKISGHLKTYIKEIFRKAHINKASRIYEHGISMQQTAKLLGISLFELAEYAGQTGIADVDLSITKPVQERLKIAQDLFG
jgi:hypothetical protein